MQLQVFAIKEKAMPEQETWRELLKTVISDAREKQRIAQELGLNPVTLSRWVTQESVPRPHNLRKLLNVLPRQREQLLDLIREEEGFEEFSDTGIEDESDKEIPSEFYYRVFSARASTTETMRYWSICNTILQQALLQLDPDRQGMAITIVRCMSPHPEDNKIYSLRESIALGTPPWTGNLDQKSMFLGAESVAGYVVSVGRYIAIQNVETDTSLILISKVEHERSSAVFPVMYAGRIAGCLIVSSHQYNYFLSQARLSLIQEYAHLVALAFEPEEFYDLEDIALRPMPAHDIQKGHFAHFRDKVANAMIQASRNRQPINTIQAEELIWRQLEEELIQVQINS